MKDSRTSNANLGAEEPRPPIDIAEQLRRFEAWIRQECKVHYEKLMPQRVIEHLIQQRLAQVEIDGAAEFVCDVTEAQWQSWCAALGIEGDINAN